MGKTINKNLVRQKISLFFNLLLIVGSIAFAFWFTKNLLVAVCASLILTGLIVLEVFRFKGKILNKKTTTIIFVIMQIITVIVMILVFFGLSNLYAKYNTLETMEVIIVAYALLLILSFYINGVTFDLTNKKKRILLINRIFFIISTVVSIGLFALFILFIKKDGQLATNLEIKLNAILSFLGLIVITFLDMLIVSEEIEEDINNVEVN